MLRETNFQPESLSRRLWSSQHRTVSWRELRFPRELLSLPEPQCHLPAKQVPVCQDVRLWTDSPMLYRRISGVLGRSHTGSTSNRPQTRGLASKSIANSLIPRLLKINDPGRDPRWLDRVCPQEDTKQKHRIHFITSAADGVCNSHSGFSLGEVQFLPLKFQ